MAKRKKAPKKKGRGRPPKHKSASARRKHRQSYSQWYYEEFKEDISKKRSKRWRDSPEVRERVKRQGEEKRALERAKKHQQRLDDSKAASEDYWAGRQTLTPRKVMVGNKRTTVYSTGVLGRMICRTMPTLRRWIANRVLPGCTMKDEAGRYWFSLPFCKAVMEAVESVYLYDGRCSEKITRQLILESLRESGLSWSAFNYAGRKTTQGKKKGRVKKNHAHKSTKGR